MNLVLLTLTGFTSFPTKTSVQNFKYMGSIAPLNNFDPLKISNSENVKYLREAELMHGRIAMLSCAIIPSIEALKLNDLGINYLSKMDLNSQLPFWCLMGLIEFYRMKIGWINPFTNPFTNPLVQGKSTKFSLKDDYQPGNLLNYNIDKVSDQAYNSELSNGRLAMLAIMFMMGKELFFQNPIVGF